MRTRPSILLGFVVIIMAVTILQERRTENALDALRDLSSPRALVIRDGVPTRIAGRDVVRDDMLILVEGDRVPADGIVLQAHELAADESMLTGESVAVDKVPESRPGLSPARLIVRGQGSDARHRHRRQRPSWAASANRCRTSPSNRRHCARRSALLTRRLAVIAIGLCLVLAVLFWMLRGGLLDALACGHHAGDGHTAAGIPGDHDRLPCAGRAAHRRPARADAAPRRHRNAGRNDGAVRGQDRHADPEPHDRDRAVWSTDKCWKRRILPAASCPRSITSCWSMRCWPAKSIRTIRWSSHFTALPANIWPTRNTCIRTGRWRASTNFSPELLAMSHLWRNDSGKQDVVATKGAPEAIADLCHLPEEARQRVSREAALMADRGLRVLGVAKAKHSVDQGLARHPARFRLRVRRAGRSRRSVASRGAQRSCRMPPRRNSRGDDHRRPSAHCARHCRQRRYRRRRIAHRCRTGRDGRGDTGAAHRFGRASLRASRRNRSSPSSKRSRPTAKWSP